MFPEYLSLLVVLHIFILLPFLVVHDFACVFFGNNLLWRDCDGTGRPVCIAGGIGIHVCIVSGSLFVFFLGWRLFEDWLWQS